ncbi:MAG: 50S ribosomal protein L15 [Endomicrobia bacterium]|nr:50S ribosomal protein L15 [Endomicrobiia bacterium]
MAITLSNLKPKFGSKHKPKRIGCGEGSGHGGSGSTRGMKGQRSRSGEGKNPGFEGGQMPLLRRIPKYGFSNKKFSKVFSIVHIEDILKKIPAEVLEVTPEVLYQYGLIKKVNLPVKIICKSKDVKVNRKLKLCVQKCSASVVKLLETNGGEYVKLDT